MPLQQLDAGLLHSAIVHSCYNLIQQREALNAINLFPVADGDTGDNMSATARAIVAYSAVQPSLEATFKSIADAGILGARGNSGMIFSQFFNGMLENKIALEQLNTQYFALLIASACASVRSAILRPVEGTILTVMEAWAKSLQLHATTTDCFDLLLQKTLDDVERALQSTTTSLAVLQAANVVDAGALGFSLFIKGFSAFVTNPQSVFSYDENMPCDADHHDLPTSNEIPNKRYCTEAVLASEEINKAQLSQVLEEHGDSIVLTANQRLCRMHLHCDEPWRVFSTLQTMGKVQYPKVDDMLRQYQSLHQRRFPIALVADSSANIPQEVLDYYQITLISLNVHMDGHDLLDRYSLDPDNFYDSLAALKNYPTTSFPAPGIIQDKIRHLAEHYEHVLIISVAQALSGTHDAFVKAGQNYANVHVINSRQVSGGQGLLINHAAEMIADGHDIETIKQSLESRIAKTRLFVMVDQFDSLIRSGRISKLKAKFAQFSGIKPIISLDNDGKGIIYDRAFSETKALAKLITIFTQLSAPAGLEEYCIVHAGVKEKADEFALMTTEAFGQAPLFIEPVSTAIGLHAGKGCVAIAAIMR